MNKVVTENRILTSISPLIRRRRIVKLTGVYGLLVLIVTLALSPLTIIGGVVQGVIFLGALFAMLYVIELYKIDVAIDEVFWNALIDEYGLKRTYGLNDTKLDGVLAYIARQKVFTSKAEGTYGDYTLRIGTQTIFPKRRMFERPHLFPKSYSYKVMEITTKENYYHVFMDSKVNDYKNGELKYLAWVLRKNQQLHTEGDVNKIFNIYVPKDSQIDGLVTLTPDTLIVARDYGLYFDLEFIGYKVNVISPYKIKTSEDIIGYTTYIFDLLANLRPMVRSARKATSDNKLIMSEK